MKQIKTILTATALAASLVAACSPASDEGASAAEANTGFLEMVSFADTDGSVIIGNPDAKVELVEYASLTCGHCKSFHEDVLTTVRSDYIATGKVRYVFQEFPTPPVEIAVAGFAIARCTGEDGYLDVLDDFFAAQDDIFTRARAGNAGDALSDLAGRHGLDRAEFEACITNVDHRRAISDSVDRGRAQGINATPSLILNGKSLDSVESRTATGLSAIIETALAEAGTASSNSDTNE